MSHTELTPDQSRFIHDLSRILTVLNMPIMAARVYCYLLLVDEPVSLADISKTLGSNQSNICTGALFLEHQGSAKRVITRGSRRVFYVASDSPGAPFRQYIELLQKMSCVIRDRSKTIPAEACTNRLNRVMAFNAELRDFLEDSISRWHNLPEVS